MRDSALAMRWLFTASAIPAASVVLLTLLISVAKAETITSKRIAQAKRLLPLQKITVGPDDQYSAAFGPDERLVFTHKADLIAHLQIQDLKTGEVKDLLPLTSDSQQPVFSNDGRLAFAYYRFDARGDICFAKIPEEKDLPLRESDIKCLKRAGGSSGTLRSNPFWRSKSELGFLERDLGGQTNKIIIANLVTGREQELVSGKLWSPAMREGGRFLAYNEWINLGDGAKRHLVLRDLENGSAHPVRLSIPGLSGFPALSEDESELFFSHFLNDTNADSTIDGSDNGVIFRVSVQDVVSAHGAREIFPEQLTSVETSCNFPSLAQSAFFVTCAFEGSLDVYRLPATGIIPPDWDERILLNALRSSRSYQDRILLRNAMKYRFHRTDRKIDESQLNDHVLADDTLAARFYIDRLDATATKTERLFHGLLRIYLEGRELKKRLPPGELSREFRRKFQALEERARAVSGEKHMRELVLAWLKEFAGDTRESAQLFARTGRGRSSGLERVIRFDLAERVRLRQGERGLLELVAEYRDMMTAPEMDGQSKIYYAFSLLKRVSQASASPLERIRLIEGVLPGLASSVATLLKSEIAVLKLIEAREEKQKIALYGELDKLMIASKSNDHLRRALYVRAIVNFAEKSEFRFLGYIAENWLRYTSLDDTEFSYAREVLANASLDQAYANLAANKTELAANYFYQSLSLTDDLESHLGYIALRSATGERRMIDDRYKALKAQNLVGDNLKFVEAYLTLIDQSAQSAKDPVKVDHLDAALVRLLSMEQDRDSSVRYLLLGYCYMEKLLRSASGYDFDPALLKSAHRSLMLAYDLGRDNERIKASALINLGILHSRVQNFGQAARFFALRSRLGFDTDDARADFTWIYALALSRSHQAETAAAILAELPGSTRTAPVIERQAFNAFTAGQYEVAERAYAELSRQAGEPKTEMNIARVELARGLTLIKLERASEARVALLRSIGAARGLKKIPPSGARLIDFEPKRVLIAAFGLLGQIGSEAERRSALEERARLIRAEKGLLPDHQAMLMQVEIQLAHLYETVDPRVASKHVAEGLRLAEQHGDENHYLGHATFQTISAALSHGILHRDLYSADDRKRAEKIADRCLAAYSAQKPRDQVLDAQELRLRILKDGFSSQVGGGKGVNLQNSELWLKVKEEQPAIFPELERLAKAVL